MNKDDFISGLKDFYFNVLKEFFPGVTREEFNEAFDKSIEIGDINK